MTMSRVRSAWFFRIHRVRPPKEPHEKQDVRGVEAGSYPSGLFGGVEELTDDCGDWCVGLVDHILCGRRVEGFVQ
jgi:hypothetical protein